MLAVVCLPTVCPGNSADIAMCLQYEALGFLLGGLGFYFLLGQLARYNDKASKKPYVRPI